MDNIAPDFALRSRLYPGGNYGADIKFRPGRLGVLPRSDNSFNVSETDAIDLAVRILTAYAPGKLAGSGAPIQRVDAARVKHDGDPLDCIARGRLKGAFVNVVEGWQAPTVAFGDLAPAEREADRLASAAPGKRVLTLRIESARQARVETTIEKD